MKHERLLKWRTDLRYAVTMIQRLTEELEDGPAAEEMRKAEHHLLLAKQKLGCSEESALAVILKLFRRPKTSRRRRKLKGQPKAKHRFL